MDDRTETVTTHETTTTRTVEKPVEPEPKHETVTIETHTEG